MPPIIVTADNIPDVLAQIAERQDEQSAAIELLAEQLADQSIRTDEALHTQAAALKATTAEHARSISEIAKATKQNGTKNGTSNGNNGTATDGSNGNSDNNPGDAAARTAAAPTVVANGNPKGIAGAGVEGEANLGPIEATAKVGGKIGNGNGQSRTRPAAKAEEPEPIKRRGAHRWI